MKSTILLECVPTASIYRARSASSIQHPASSINRLRQTAKLTCPSELYRITDTAFIAAHSAKNMHLFSPTNRCQQQHLGVLASRCTPNLGSTGALA
eukprot:927677-Rhodomonas_salina.6